MSRPNYVPPCANRPRTGRQLPAFKAGGHISVDKMARLLRRVFPWLTTRKTRDLLGGGK